MPVGSLFILGHFVLGFFNLLLNRNQRLRYTTIFHSPIPYGDFRLVLSEKSLDVSHRMASLYIPCLCRLRSLLITCSIFLKKKDSNNNKYIAKYYENFIFFYTKNFAILILARVNLRVII